jgi:hypothetical protein
MSSTLPEPQDRIAALEAENARLRERARKCNTLERMISAPQPAQSPVDDTWGIPEGYDDPVACRVRARRRRIAASALRVVR